MTATEGLIALPGGSLYYEEQGNGPSLVFIHAGIADSRMWGPQVAVFAGNYHVVRYDMRGFGRSPLPEESFFRHEDLRALLDHLAIDRAVLIGSSIGGQTAIDFTLAYPERVRALVAVCSGVTGFGFDHYDGPYLKEWDLIHEAIEAGDAAAANELIVRLWIDGMGRTPDQVDPYVRTLALAMNRPIVEKEIAGGGEGEALEPAAIDRLDEIIAPTLVIMTTLDPPDSQALSQTLAQEIPHARLAIIEGAGHLPNLEQPDDFDRLLGDFLAGLS
jgi:3-oxoadipate enol-lactonase